MEAFNPFSLDDKTILVTGASSGIGKAISVACSKMGATLILNGRNSNKLQSTYSLLKEGNHSIFEADLTEFESIRKMVEELPALDGIVFCAGIGQRLPCKLLTVESIDQVMDVNFKSTVVLQAELLRQKKINKGASIIFIASIASWAASFGNAIYSASKGAIISYSKCLSLELAPRQIRVNCISPGMVWTDLILNGDVEIEQLKEDEKQYPLKRYGQPEDIANLAIYMLSDASSWMTGSDVKIAGGL